MTNGDQTDTIAAALTGNGSFESALATREFEPDSPNYTPRISGIVDLNDQKNSYRLSILKSFNHDPKVRIRNYFNYSQAVPGIGHCLHTYTGNGDPLPSFAGEPYPVPLAANDATEIAQSFWEVLDRENRVALLVKLIDPATGNSTIKIINQLG